MNNNELEQTKEDLFNALYKLKQFEIEKYNSRINQGSNDE